MEIFGKALILFGIVLIVAGIIFVSGLRVPWLGHLPGDIYIQKGRFSFYFPLTTCILISLLLILVLYLLKR